MSSMLFVNLFLVTLLLYLTFVISNQEDVLKNVDHPLVISDRDPSFLLLTSFDKASSDYRI